MKVLSVLCDFCCTLLPLVGTESHFCKLVGDQHRLGFR
jgi:hypothetical protein